MSDRDEMMEGLRKAGIINPAHDDEKAWADYRDRVVPLLSRADRQHLIAYADYCLEGETKSGIQVTKETAKLFQRKRDLEDIDAQLWRAGR